MKFGCFKFKFNVEAGGNFYFTHQLKTNNFILQENCLNLLKVFPCAFFTAAALCLWFFIFKNRTGHKGQGVINFQIVLFVKKAYFSVFKISFF